MNDPNPEVLEAFEERQSVFDCLISKLDTNKALFVIVINEVLYRYQIGWSAPYGESVIQAKDIGAQILEQSPMESKEIQTLIKAVYTFWFNDSFSENVNVEACEEILLIYQEYLAGKYQ